MDFPLLFSPLPLPSPAYALHFRVPQRLHHPSTLGLLASGSKLQVFCPASVGTGFGGSCCILLHCRVHALRAAFLLRHPPLGVSGGLPALRYNRKPVEVEDWLMDGLYIRGAGELAALTLGEV